MQAKGIRLPLLSILLSLCLSFCARADVIYDTMTNASSSAYIVHAGEDDNRLEVEITGDYVIKKLVPAGTTTGTGIPRDYLRIRIPELKLNITENPHAEYKDFFEVMEEGFGLSGQYDGFLNTQIQRAGESIRIDSSEYTDYSQTGSFETTFVNNREITLNSTQQPVSFLVPDPPQISLFYKNEKRLGERYIYEGLPDEFLLHDIYLGAYAVHSEKDDRYEIMMERLLRLRYRDRYYQIRYHLHDPSETKGSYQQLKENLSYLSLPDLSLQDDAEESRYRFVGWRMQELGEGSALTGPGSSEASGLPQTKSSESPMVTLSMMTGTQSASLYDAVRTEQPTVLAAAAALDAIYEERRQSDAAGEKGSDSGSSVTAAGSVASGSNIATGSVIRN